jgi:hypothetical protein
LSEFGRASFSSLSGALSFSTPPPGRPSRGFNSERKEAAAAAAAAAAASLSSSFFFFAHEEYTLSFSSLLSHPKKINKKQKQLVLV